MPSVYISHSYADRPIAAQLVSALQAKGLTTNIEAHDMPGASIIVDQQQKLDTSDVVVLLWSQAAARSDFVLEEIQRAIKAWSNDRLVIARLDATELPSGLADLPSIELGTDREAGLRRVVALVGAVARPTSATRPLAAPEHPQRARSGWGMALAGMVAAWLVVGAVAAMLRWSWPVARLPGDTPGDTPGGLGTFEHEILLWAVGGSALIAAAAGLFIFWRRNRRSTAPQHHGTPDASLPRSNAGTPHQIFISYSRRDERDVDDLVKRIERAGYSVWIDRRAKPGGGRYAAPIVAAIRGARVVAVMCSTNAAKSDHVVREIYVAGDFRKPFIVFELDDGELPDELLYFLTGFPRIEKTQAHPDAIATHVAQFVPM